MKTIGLLAAIAAVSTVAFADPPFLANSCDGSAACVVAAPYDAPGLRTKAVFLGGVPAHAGDALHPDGFAAEPGFKEKFKKDVSIRVECLYQGFDLKIDPLNGSDSKCAGNPWKRTCDLVKNELVLKNSSQVEEISANHVGQTCGQTASISVERLGLTSWRPVVTYQDPAAEASWLNGGFPQALACYWKKTGDAIESSDKLVVQPGSGCYNIAANVVNARTRYNNLMNAQQGLVTQANIKEIDVCEQKIRISAPLLCAARTNLEAAFAILARCEVSKNARRSWALTVGSPAWRASFKKKVFDDLKASGSCQAPRMPANVSRMSLNQLDQAADQAVNAVNGGGCLSRTYGNKVLEEIREFIETRWPSDGNCQSKREADPLREETPVYASSLIPGIAALSSLLRRRRRVSRSSLLEIGLVVAMVGFLHLSVTGCSKSKTPRETNDMAAGISDNNYNPGTYDEEQAAAALNDTDFERQIADSYVSDSNDGFGTNPNGPGGPGGPGSGNGTPGSGGSGSIIPWTSGATAGTGGLGNGTGSSGNNGAGSMALGGAGDPGGAITRGGAGGSGGGYGANRGLASLGGQGSMGATGTASGAGNTPSGGALGAAANSAYTGGGAAAHDGSSAAASDGGLLAAMVAAGGAGLGAGAGNGDNNGLNPDGSGQGQDQFGAGKGEVAAMGTPDPEDYFMKTDIDVSLFKRVSDRCKRKAMDWSLAAAEDALHKSQQARMPANAAPRPQAGSGRRRSDMEMWVPNAKTF